MEDRSRGVDVSFQPRRLRTTLLLCGLLSGPLYIATDAAAGLLWEGYSFTNQAISELSAIGAPTRTLELALGFTYTGLTLAFGAGVWKFAQRRAGFVTGIVVLAIGALGLVWAFFPIHLTGSEVTITDTIHTVLAGVNVTLFLLAVGFGSFAATRSFLVYSLSTLGALLAVGAISFALAGSQMASQGILAPPPWFGLIERIDAYLCVLWLAVLAAVLLRERDGPTSVTSAASSPNSHSHDRSSG